MIDEIKSAFKDNKWAIYASIAILFISLILGYVLEPYLHAYLNPIVEDLTQKVQTGVIQVTFVDIFFNNFRIILQMFLYGLLFCFSAVILSFNGFFVGYYAAISPDLFKVILYIVPHGIFEFSSCILACASGFTLFNFLFKFLKTFIEVENDSVLESLRNSFNVNFIKLKQAFILFGIAAILMVIAAVIEVYMTAAIAEFLLSII